jgi:hypothetical protein
MRVVALMSLALCAGCWDFDRLAGLHDAGRDGGVPAMDDGGSAPPGDLATAAPPSDLAGPCTSGAPCATGSAGICAAGHVTCTAGGAVCTPDHVARASELCHDDSDDDCDGRVNNGCPDHLALGAERRLTPRGGSGGSTVKSLRCPAGSFVVNAGMWGSNSNAAATGIEIACASLSLVDSGSSYTLAKQVLPGTLRAQAGNAAQTYRGISTAADCAGNNLRAGTWFTSHISSTDIVQPPVPVVAGFGAHCGVASLVPGIDNELNTRLAALGNDYDDVCYESVPGVCRGSDDEDRCQSNEVLVGFDLRLGELMDQIAAVCAPIVTVYK